MKLTSIQYAALKLALSEDEYHSKDSFRKTFEYNSSSYVIVDELAKLQLIKIVLYPIQNGGYYWITTEGIKAKAEYEHDLEISNIESEKWKKNHKIQVWLTIATGISAVIAIGSLIVAIIALTK